MTDTYTCTRCEETKPVSEFRSTPHTARGHVQTCSSCHGEICGGGDTSSADRGSYINEDANEERDPPTVEECVAKWGLDENDKKVAREAAKRARAYRRSYVTGEPHHGKGYGNEGAEEYVDRMMGEHEEWCEPDPREQPHECTCGMSAGEPTKRRVRVLQTAIAMSHEDNLDLTTRPNREDYEEAAA